MTRLSRVITPDPFVLAVGLTVFTALLAWVLTPSGPVEILDAWQGPRGFFGLLGFSMQMCLVLVTGHALASAPLATRLLDQLAERPKTGPSAGALVALVTMASALVNWGLGLMVGALLARRVAESAARRGLRVHYPLLAAAGYTGMMVWHGGFSGSAPLKVTTRADLVELLGPELGAVMPTISLFETLLSPLNLVTTLGLCVIVPVTIYFLTPSPEDCVTAEPVPMEAAGEAKGAEAETWADRLERGPWVTMVLVLPLFAYLLRFVGTKGIANLDLNFVNLSLFAAGLVLHGNPRAYLGAVQAAVFGCAGIIIQFPLYAGIMGIMSATGLAKVLADLAVTFASAETYGVLTFLFAGLINLFVPSGGGQWAVQGPIALEAASRLGVPLRTAVMAVAYGDQWTNMLQPFWALPLLGLTGLRARDMFGYTAVVFLISGIWIVATMFVLG